MKSSLKLSTNVIKLSKMYLHFVVYETQWKQLMKFEIFLN